MRKTIEYTKLGNISKAQILKEIEFVNKSKPRAFVISYNWVPYVRDKIDSRIKLVTVGGYPFSSIESALGIISAVDELDIVIPLESYYTQREIIPVYHVIENTKKAIGNKTLKVIMETCLMANKEFQICELVKCIEDAGADVVKTNTGMYKKQMIDSGTERERKEADLYEDLRYLKEWTNLPIKVAGGIRNKLQAKSLLKLGATYIGTSSRFWNERKQQNDKI